MFNGRFPSDIGGEYTCLSNDGVSAVDYMIASSVFFQYVTDFAVLDKDDSDHFPISCS